MKHYKIKESNGNYFIYKRVLLIFWTRYDRDWKAGYWNNYPSFAKANRRMRELEYRKNHKK